MTLNRTWFTQVPKPNHWTSAAYSILVRVILMGSPWTAGQCFAHHHYQARTCELSNHNRDRCDVIKRSDDKNLHTPLHVSTEINSIRTSTKRKWLCQIEQWAFSFTEIKWKELKPNESELFLEWTSTVRTNWRYISKNTVWCKVTSICWAPPFWIFMTSCDSPYFWARSFK